jgi:hypothetical protein
VDSEPDSGPDEGQTDRDEEAAAVQRQLSTALAEACRSSGLDRMLLNSRGHGGGEVALFPVGIDEPRAVAALVDGLSCALHRINGLRSGSARPRLRLKVAVHEGITVLAASGFAGHAVAKTCQLLDSPPLRAALASNPRASLAVMLSDRVFEDTSQFGHPRLPAERFERVEIDDPLKGSAGTGWIYVPDSDTGHGEPVSAAAARLDGGEAIAVIQHINRTDQ